MRYSYTDTFLTKDKDDISLEALEDDAVNEVALLNVTHDFYVEKLVTSIVYMQLCKEQFEDESVRKKYDVYKSEFEKYLKQASNTPVVNATIARG